MQPNYREIEWGETSDLKSHNGTQFLLQIDYNLSQVYLLEDSSYLVASLNPFGKSVVIKDKTLLDKWINESYFPVHEKAFDFYLKNKDKIERLLDHKENLKIELFKFLSITKPIEQAQEIDHIQDLLKKKRAFGKYKLHFIVLVGDYLMKHHSAGNVKWGVIENKQLLNPIRNLILIKEENDEKRYFKLEYYVAGKWGYTGIQGIEHSYGRRWSRVNNFDPVRELTQ